MDIEPQPNYPFAFIQADALEYAIAHGLGYDAIHASPPCQGYSPHVSSAGSQWVPTEGKNEPRLIAPTREILQRLMRPFVIENVIGARSEMRGPVMLCGSMFGLPIARHRLFESNILLDAPRHEGCKGVAKRFAEERGWEYRDMSVTGKGRRKGTAERWKEILGLPADAQMTQHQLAESIPPAYTKHIGLQLYAAIELRRMLAA